MTAKAQRKPVFTVGNENAYDKGLRELKEKFEKLGARPAQGYPGGFALQSVADARRLIKEFDKQMEWAVYSLDADWDKDTVPSTNGWWHALVNDSRVLRKVMI